MRPQRLAAEILQRHGQAQDQREGFNEAAAISCGDHTVEQVVNFLQDASMRPQRLAAEISE